jgi:hypothetical protein
MSRNLPCDIVIAKVYDRYKLIYRLMKPYRDYTINRVGFNNFKIVLYRTYKDLYCCTNGVDFGSGTLFECIQNVKTFSEDTKAKRHKTKKK